MLGLPASSAAPFRKIARVVIGVGMLAAVTAGCSEDDSSSTAAAGSDDIAAVAAAPTEKPVDDAERLRAALASTGVKPAFSDDMLQALGDGVCHQLRGRHGSSDDHRESADGIAERRERTDGHHRKRLGRIDNAPSADQLAEVFVDAAEADYCR